MGTEVHYAFQDNTKRASCGAVVSANACHALARGSSFAPVLMFLEKTCRPPPPPLLVNP